MILLGATAAFQIGRVPLNWDEDPISKIGRVWGSGHLGLFQWQPVGNTVADTQSHQFLYLKNVNFLAEINDRLRLGQSN